MLKNTYQNINLIIVNDGSTDKTLELLIDKFELYNIPVPTSKAIKTSAIRGCYASKNHNNLRVIDKEHNPANTPADALNAGLNAVTTALFVTVDADTILEPEALKSIVFKFISNSQAVAIGGSICVLNDNIVKQGHLFTKAIPKNIVAAIQSVEYLRAFFYGRAGLNYFSGALSYPGAFTLITTQIAREVGGYDVENFANDTEITLSLHNYLLKNNYPYSIKLASNSIAWTIVPNSLKSFWLQRNKWHRGMMRSVSRYLGMFLNPKYGWVGMIEFPCYVLFDLFSPVVEFISYIILLLAIFWGFINWEYTLWLWFLAWGYIVLLSSATSFLRMITDRSFDKFTNMLKIIGFVTVEMLGFRQFNAACCFFATIQYIFNRWRGKPL